MTYSLLDYLHFLRSGLFLLRFLDIPTPSLDILPLLGNG